MQKKKKIQKEEAHQQQQQQQQQCQKIKCKQKKRCIRYNLCLLADIAVAGELKQEKKERNPSSLKDIEQTTEEQERK